MRRMLLPLAAAATFGAAPYLSKLGVVSGSAALVALGVLLAVAASAAPPAAATALEKQWTSYGETKKAFVVAKPGSAAGQAAAKHSYQVDNENLARKTF